MAGPLFRAPFSIPLYATPEITERFARDGQRILAEFHELYYHSMVWVDRTRWRGVPVSKPPGDLWVLQEIIFELTPDLIVESGTAHGGSAAFMASMLDLNQRGRIVTIDKQHYDGRPVHPRIEYLSGSSTDPAIVDVVRERARGLETVLVVLDSAHVESHVRQEIAFYAPLVTRNSYLIVEDGNVDGNPVLPNYVCSYTGIPSGGPQAAIQAFVAGGDAFVIDSSRHKFLMTFNPNGYLKRVK
ncbi:MAG TPA: CmcI family methyltransferase [Candidatus Sulfotelmatobacter sp.]|nr:CmcI family methyltransferase [Candidatus Sulfotelmatobacter sp.]